MEKENSYSYSALNFVNSNSKIPSLLCAFVKFIFEKVDYGAEEVHESIINQGFGRINKKQLDSYDKRTKPEDRKISEIRKFPFFKIVKKNSYYLIENRLKYINLLNLKVKNKEILNSEIDSTLILLLLNRDKGLNFYVSLTNELKENNVKFYIDYLILIFGVFKDNNSITSSMATKFILNINEKYNKYIKTNKNINLRQYIKSIFEKGEYNIITKFKTCEDYAVTAFYYLEKTLCFNINKNFCEKYLEINKNYYFKINYFLNNSNDIVFEEINKNNFIYLYKDINIEKFYVEPKINLNNPNLISVKELYKKDYTWADFECRNVISFCQQLYLDNKEVYKSSKKGVAIKLNSLKKPTSTTSGIPDLYIKTNDLLITIEPCNSNTTLQLCNNEYYSCKKHLEDLNKENLFGICIVVTPKKLKQDNDYEKLLKQNNIFEYIDSKTTNRRPNYILTLSEEDFTGLILKKDLIKNIKSLHRNENKRCYNFISNVNLKDNNFEIYR